LPELPEVEAWRRQLDPLVKRSPIEKAGPAHIATLKTFDPPLSILGGKTFRGVERRAKRFLLPTDDDELVLLVHLMSAGRLKYVPPNGKGAKTPVLRVRFVDGGELQLTEAGSKKRAGVWLLTPEAARAELAHLGPEADTLTNDDVARILASDSRRLHSLLRDQRLIAGIGRAWANEILHLAQLSPYALSTELAPDEVERLSKAIDERLTEGLALREAGANDAKAYRIHDRLGQPCPRCGTPIARVDFEQHTIYYCPQCQTAGRTLKDRRLSRLLR
jgi:formamidopyrimidine-DNA glycosylase